MNLKLPETHAELTDAIGETLKVAEAHFAEVSARLRAVAPEIDWPASPVASQLPGSRHLDDLERFLNEFMSD